MHITHVSRQTEISSMENDQNVRSGCVTWAEAGQAFVFLHRHVLNTYHLDATEHTTMPDVS